MLDWLSGMRRPKTRRQERVSGGSGSIRRPEPRRPRVRHPRTLLAFGVLVSLLVAAILALGGIGLRRLAGFLVLVGTLNTFFFLYLLLFRRKTLDNRGHVTLVCLLALSVLLLARLATLPGWPAHLVPVTFATVVLAVVFDRRFALETSWILLVYVAVVQMTAPEADAARVFRTLLVLTAGMLAAVVGTGRIRTRGKILAIGALIGVVQLVTIAAIHLVWGRAAGETPADVVATLCWGLAHGILVGFVVSGSLPLVEYLFRISTDISLLELSNIAQQTVLRRLLVAAPGTYNHSFVVGMLAEEAAEAIGANPLLARVGGYYHDIGKMLKPEYYGENELIPGLHHRSLTPAMSTIIIKAHVKDGAELGRHHDLPKPIVDVIEQHHGTTLVEYFYGEALKQAKNGERVEESMFRYEGPKPQTKEAGIVMLADSVEAATRSLSDPTPSRVEGTIRKISRKKLDDEQLDECGLTLKEVRRIEESFIRVLSGIFHRRPKYPNVIRRGGRAVPGAVVDEEVARARAETWEDFRAS